MMMSIYLLVHGAFMGGWVYRQVAQFLRAAGHEVFTPTLTGFGERAHLVNPEINLNTHIQDIVGVLECEDLSRVILVGYSYGGLVVTGVAERVPERLTRLVYLDAFIPKDGQSAFDCCGPENAKQFLDLAREHGDGWRVPVFDNPPRWQPQPVKTLTQPIEVRNSASVGIPRAYIHCTIRPKEHPIALSWPALDFAAEEAKRRGWWYRDIFADHGVVFTMPKELAELLLELA
jgi:pimeloyl-ACP methyl ester carboxylesterase